MKLIQGASVLEAWQAGSEYLINNNLAAYNVLVSFPCATNSDEALLRKFDPRTILGAKYDCSRDVANTIFPAKSYLNSCDRFDLYTRYLDAHSRSRKRAWGTYFQRFVSFGGGKINQLERVISALATWGGNYHAALLMHTSSGETDALRPLGGPCLQYVQFNCPTKPLVDLLAVYRNHDYCNKVLGNFIGLSRLLRFVCKETDRTAGSITCLSAHAYLPTSRKKQRILAGLP